MPLLIFLFCNIFLFSPFLLGERIFIGNPDRLNSSLAYLFQFANGRRQEPVSFWGEAIFGGFDCGKVSWISPGPLDFLLSYFPQDWFLTITLGSSFILFNLLGFSNYCFFKEISAKKWESALAAALVCWSYISVLRVTQNDSTFAVLVISPLLLLAFRRSILNEKIKALGAIALLVFFLARFCFLQEAAYVLGFALIYGAALAVANGKLAQVGWCLVSVVCGLLGAAPRIHSVASEMNMLVRREASLPFQQLWQFQNIRPWEALRFLDNTAFGRTHAENSLSNVNFSEGFQLFTSQVVPFILLAGLILYWRRRSSPRLLCPGEALGLGIPLACAFFIVLSSGFYWLVYLFFGKLDFTHTRLGVAALTPLGVFVVYALATLGSLSGEKGYCAPVGRGFVLPLSLGLFVAGLIWGITAFVPPDKAIHIPVGRMGWTGPDLGRMIYLRWQSVVTVCLSGAFVLAAMAVCRERKAVWTSRHAACFLASLALFQALGAAKFQLWGPHTLTGVPFYMGNSWHPTRTQYSLPDPKNARDLRERVESYAYRSVIIASEKESPGITANSVAFFWGLRGIDGYAQGVPKNLSWLPWGKENIQLRQIHFADEKNLPWPVLAACNVKYAIKATQSMLRGKAEYDQLTILENPVKPCPRVFVPTKIHFCENPQKTILDIAGQNFENLSSFENVSWCKKLTNEQDKTVIQGNCLIILSETNGIKKVDIKERKGGVQILVLNERFDSNWIAWADSTPLEVREVNGFMVGVFLKTKENTVYLGRREKRYNWRKN